MAVAVALSNGFGKKGGKRAQYAKEPLDLGLETEAEKRVKAQKEREKIINSLTAWKKAWDKQQQQKGVE